MKKLSIIGWDLHDGKNKAWGKKATTTEVTIGGVHTHRHTDTDTDTDTHTNTHTHTHTHARTQTHTITRLLMRKSRRMTCLVTTDRFYLSYYQTLIPLVKKLWIMYMMCLSAKCAI